MSRLLSPRLVRLSLALMVGCSGGGGDESASNSGPGDTWGGSGKADTIGGGGSAGNDGANPWGDSPSEPESGEEACGDGLDNDLDGQVDEGCACEAEATQPCYDGPPNTRNQGACADGMQRCEVSGEFTSWGACQGGVTPAVEDCGDGLDNDCDGLVDCLDDQDCGPCAMQCTITHGYDVALVETVDGAGLLEPCGAGCADLWVGQIGDNYWSGNCAIFEQEARINVFSPTAIKSAILERALWDDYMQIYLNGAMVWTGPNGDFPPETGGSCELSTSWDTAPGTNLTPYFAVAGEILFRIRVSVTGGGEGYARIRLLYDPETLITDHGWTPDDCVQAARSIADGECSGTVTCVDGPAPGGCVDINGLSVCEDDVDGVISSPIAGISPLCRSVAVDLTSCP